MASALAQANNGIAPRMVWYGDAEIGTPDLIVLPGGFSYGDYLRCGAMAAHAPAMKEVIRLANEDTAVFGVCNGFQTLIETGLLPGALLRNESLNFVCRQVTLEHIPNNSRLMASLPQDFAMTVPVAHGEGNYFASEEILEELEQENRIIFRYADGDNPNGSIQNIAGISNRRGNVLGMMPHPENATAAHQGNQSAAPFFEALIGALQKVPRAA